MKWFKLVLVCIFVLGCSKGTNTTEQASTESQAGDLIRACARGDYDRALTLIDGGIDVNEKLGTKEKPITPLLAAMVMGHEDVAILLLDRGAATHLTFAGYNALDFSRHMGANTPFAKSLLRNSLKARGGEK